MKPVLNQKSGAPVPESKSASAPTGHPDSLPADEHSLTRHSASFSHAIVDPAGLALLADRLMSESTPARIRDLLRCADMTAKGAIPLDIIFTALRKLACSDSVFLRAEAYRRFARLHQVDLRYEMRAKRELRKALDREHGLARARVQALMRCC